MAWPTNDSPFCDTIKLRNVFLYPTEYLTYGAGKQSSLITKPDGSKEYRFFDHLGSSRAVKGDSGFTFTDYAPFGELLGGGTESRKGFIDKEKDGESDIRNHGVRSYDDDLGRFLSVDALWEKYTSLSPYHYAALNPISFFDIDGRKVEVFTERITMSTLINGSFLYVDGVVAYVGFAPRHTFIRVTTDKLDLTLELGGPQNGSKKGTPIMKDISKDGFDRRFGMKEHDVSSPASSDNFAFEKKVIEVYNMVVSELPDYEFLNTNSNGFAAFLIKKAGGDVDLPYNSYGSNDLSAYELAYTVALGKQVSAAMRAIVVPEPQINRKHYEEK